MYIKVKQKEKLNLKRKYISLTEKGQFFLYYFKFPISKKAKV
jgi:hypothetical protein